MSPLWIGFLLSPRAIHIEGPPVPEKECGDKSPHSKADQPKRRTTSEVPIERKPLFPMRQVRLDYKGANQLTYERFDAEAFGEQPVTFHDQCRVGLQTRVGAAGDASPIAGP